jgi:hypothetical protein
MKRKNQGNSVRLDGKLIVDYLFKNFLDLRCVCSDVNTESLVTIEFPVQKKEFLLTYEIV